MECRTRVEEARAAVEQSRLQLEGVRASLKSGAKHRKLLKQHLDQLWMQIDKVDLQIDMMSPERKEAFDTSIAGYWGLKMEMMKLATLSVAPFPATKQTFPLLGDR